MTEAQEEEHDWADDCLQQMLDAYAAVRSAGLKHVQLGNVGVFAETRAEQQHVLEATRGSAERNNR